MEPRKNIVEIECIGIGEPEYRARWAMQFDRLQIGIDHDNGGDSSREVLIDFRSNLARSIVW